MADLPVYFDMSSEIDKAVAKVNAVMETALRDEVIWVLRRQGYTVIPPVRGDQVEVWTEYRSAVLYRTRSTEMCVRETAATRRTRVEAQRDADQGLPGLHRDPDEPEVFRAIVSRPRVEPGEWQLEAELPS